MAATAAKIGQIASSVLPALVSGVVSGIQSSGRRSRPARRRTRRGRVDNMYNPRSRRAPPLPTPRGSRRRVTKSSRVSVPAVQSVVQSRASRGQTRVKGQETAQKLTALPATFTVTANNGIYCTPLVASDSACFPRLTAAASTYQNYNFNSCTLSYNPTAGTDTKGTVYMGFLADAASLSNISSEQDILCLPVHSMGPVWQASSLTVTRNMMNAQFLNFRNLPEQQVDYTDPTQIQGAFVYTVIGGSLAAGQAYGNVAVAYDCTLFNSKLQQTNAAVSFAVRSTTPYGGFIPFTDSDWTDPSNARHLMWDSVPGEDPEPYEDIFIRSHRSVLVHITARGTGLVDAFPTFFKARGEDEPAPVLLLSSFTSGTNKTCSLTLLLHASSGYVGFRYEPSTEIDFNDISMLVVECASDIDHFGVLPVIS